MHVPTKVLIDARNVQRSQWPNLSDAEVVELARRWADEHEHDAVIVFDGGRREAQRAPASMSTNETGGGSFVRVLTSLSE